MAEKKILLFAENFQKRILAEGIHGAINLESYLNNDKDSDRIILGGVLSSYRDKNGIYKPKDHARGWQIINANDIDFIYGAEDLVYTEDNLTSSDEVSVLWGMKGLNHALIGEIKVPGTNAPKLNRIFSGEEFNQKELEMIIYLDKQLQKNFIPLFNPRLNSDDAKAEFGALFHGIRINPESIPKILINNKKKSNSNTMQAVYLGESSKNYEE